MDTNNRKFKVGVATDDYGNPISCLTSSDTIITNTDESLSRVLGYGYINMNTNYPTKDINGNPIIDDNVETTGTGSNADNIRYQLLKPTCNDNIVIKNAMFNSGTSEIVNTRLVLPVADSKAMSITYLEETPNMISFIPVYCKIDGKNPTFLTFLYYGQTLDVHIHKVEEDDYGYRINKSDLKKIIINKNIENIVLPTKNDLESPNTTPFRYNIKYKKNVIYAGLYSNVYADIELLDPKYSNGENVEFNNITLNTPYDSDNIDTSAPDTLKIKYGSGMIDSFKRSDSSYNYRYLNINFDSYTANNIEITIIEN